MWKVTGWPKGNVVDTRGVTLTVASDDRLVDAIEKVLKKESGVTLRLKLDGVSRLPERAVAKVFLNVSKSDSTPPNDPPAPQYLGAISSFGKLEKSTHVFDLGPCLRRLVANKLWKVGDPFTVRIVLAPITPKDSVEGKSITIDMVTVEQINSAK